MITAKYLPVIYNLDRLKRAQQDCFERALNEISNGKKESHWMWYVFPQISGLGSSETAKKYALSGVGEAEAYLTDSLLSERLIRLTDILVHRVHGKSAADIFGYPDDLKFRSSMTLFYATVRSCKKIFQNEEFSCFEQALRKYFNGEIDPRTMEILRLESGFGS